MTYTFSAPCLFGLEGLVADELRRLDLAGVAAENGRVLFTGGADALARANIGLACAERVLLLVGEFEASSFDMLFEGVKGLPWENYIPKDGAFPVKGHCINSKLASVPDCQAIIKKASAARLGQKYGSSWLEETGAVYQISFMIMRDRASIYIDTTGPALHKRGYRPEAGVAPLRETLAAAMVKLSRYRGREAFRDPFCGSGTIAVEAALAAKNRAPGVNRRFAAESWKNIGRGVWEAERSSARDKEYSGAYDIWGGDIDPKCIELAEANAKRAGVDGCVRFSVADARSFAPAEPAGIVVTNPPYGERIMEKSEAEGLYRAFGRAVQGLAGWKLYILSSHTEFERTFGREAAKKRKLYNGMIKCDLFMYL